MDGCDENAGVLSANTVYALMNHQFHVSRNERTQWFFRHLNKKIQLPPENDELQLDSEIDILSIYPHDPPIEWNASTRHNYQYFIPSSANVVYISKINKAVYCIDMSPSMSAVDIQHGQVMLDEIIGALKTSVEGVVKPFIIPGTSYEFKPNLFVTVIVHTPFFTTPAQQVLVQGWKVTSENVQEFLSAIFKQLEILEDTIASVSGLVHDEIEEIRSHQAESERLVGGLFEEVPEKQIIGKGISMVSPDSGFINLLRYGMLALRLLPQSSLSNLIVVTDGMINLPDIQVLESVLSQLRSNAVAVSFLHVGSQFHPNCSHGLVPYSELLQFIASATVGAYIPSSQSLDCNGAYNVYQEAFVTWSLKKRNILPEVYIYSKNSDGSDFYGYGDPPLLTKKHCEEHLSGSLSNIICCRLHEGYLIKSVQLRDTSLEVVMVLPWSYQIFIEYIIRTDWPEQTGTKNIILYMVCIRAPYNFLHDVTSLLKKQYLSPYRQAVISKFWGTLKTLTHTDKFLSHLDSFPENTLAYTIPDGIKNGVPLFYLPSNGAVPELSSSGSSCSQIAQFWRPVVMLEPSVWPKWFHTHRLGIVLQPDQPFSHVMHAVSSNSRFHVIQCRQAEAALYSCLKKLTAFTLIENHSYIKILYPPNNDVTTPRWFYIVRVTAKPPCSVIHVAFLGGTPGRTRHQVVKTIKEEISKLKIPQRGDSITKRQELDGYLRTEVECCTIINKPLEKILIRYERMPCEFGTVVFPDGTQPVSAAKPLKPTSTLITTLSRYLHHKRYIWDAHTPSASHNNLLPTMLSTLTRMRLQEGFRYAHCSAGIINMVLEVQMKCYDEPDPAKECSGKFQPCVIQYVLFPPHLTSTSMKSSLSSDETGDEAEPELRTELITECWIEPQHGVVTCSPSKKGYIENLHYHQIADYIWKLDAECISNLLTFDNLQLMCHNQEISPPMSLDPLSHHNNPLEKWPHAVAIEDERIHRIPFAYNLMNLLPKCQQAELLNDTFVQVLSDDWNNRTRNDAPNNLLMEYLLSQLQELHHREINLSDHESLELLDLIVNRPRDASQRPIPFVRRPSEELKVNSKSTFSLKHKTVPKWRCFVKSMASTHCVLTFMPASFHDLKMLMLASECKMFKNFDSTCSESREGRVSEIPTQTMSECDSMSTRSNIVFNSKCSSRLDMGSYCSEDGGLFENIPHQRDSLFFDKFDQPFRTRSSSWDPMKKQNEALRIDLMRMRTSSVGAKLKPTSLIKTVIENNAECARRAEEANSKAVYGSIMLPIYIYDCPLSNLVDALIFKSSFERRSDIFCDGISSSKGNINDEQCSASPDEMDLHHHCRVILQAFNKCFVMALFKSLHANQRVNSHDINIAVHECNETLLEIDITNYLQAVCGHFKNGKNKLHSEGGLPCSSPCLPQEMLPLQKLMKHRFMDVLTLCFRPVPASPDFFFCCPPQRNSQPVDTGIDLVSQRLNDIDFDVLSLQSDIADYSSHQNSIVGTWEQGRVDSTMDDARTSLLSNMDSDSVSDQLTDIGDDLYPLFLHLVCSVSTPEKGLWIANPVKVLPTCFNDLFANTRDVLDVDFTSLKVVLGLHCLTLPPSYPADLPQSETPQEPGSHGPYFCDVSQPEYACNEPGKDHSRLQHLPEQQYKAVNKCTSEIEWFLQDEITQFLLDSQPITVSTLEFVVRHIANSDGRYTCNMHTVGLDFVYGPEHSLEKFVQEFSKFKLHNYELLRTGEFYYLIRSSASGSPSNPGRFKLNHSGVVSYSNSQSADEDNNSLARSMWSGSKHEYVDSFDKVYYAQKYKWIKDLEGFRTTMPNFWLIVKIDDDKVNIYFHCKFLEVLTEEVQHYKDVLMSILEHVEAVCKTVNQTLLLQSLHETRMCEPLLEPEEPDDIWKPNTYEADHVDVDIQGCNSALINKFHPGWFSCRVVWQAHFVLHPRLKTGPGKPGLSRAIQALRTVLNRFSVNNRKNMFVYQDSSGNNVFYLRLHENVRLLNRSGITDDDSPSSVSRSSSINSLTNKRGQDDSFNTVRPRLKSFGENIDMSYHQEDILTLKVHGISDAGGEVTHELVQVLQNRLDDAVLEVISVMLARNPMCKLSPDDVHFIQKPHLLAAHIIQFKIPLAARGSLEALAFYLRHNLLQFLFLPKYIDTRHVFQDFSQPEGSPRRISESNMYLYNQSPVSGHKGIACLAVAIVDSKGAIVSNRDVCKSTITCEAQSSDPSVFHEIQMKDVDDDYYGAGEEVMEVRLWKQGRVNMDHLRQKLMSILQYSLWDLITEYNILYTPLKEKNYDNELEIEEMNKTFYEVIPVWLQKGCDMSVPAVKIYSIELSLRHSVSVTLREMKHIISLHELNTYVFVEKGDKSGACSPAADLDSACSLRCFIVSCSANQYSPEANDKSKPGKDSLTKSRLVHFVPRQRFLISIITNQKVVVYMYNWSKDRVEDLSKLMSQLGIWLSSRSSFLVGVLTQKMGLFHNQPLSRKSLSQASLQCGDGTDLEFITNFSVNATPRKTALHSVVNTALVLRDAEPTPNCRKIFTNDPVSASIEQIICMKALDKKEQQDKLQVMWQSRGITPYIPLSDDTLEIFLRHTRVFHFCLTPFLFHPGWRKKSAGSLDYTSSPGEFSWHPSICSHFINEYKLYLQNLGYIPVQTAPTTPRRLRKPERIRIDEDTKAYMQKSLIGGIIMLEISVMQPFLLVKLHGIECARLQPKSLSNLILQIVLNFLDECCKIRDALHLHSFTHDYHLRSVEWYITGQSNHLPPDYHLTSFLDEFLKHYPKAPNFASSLVYMNHIVASNLSTSPIQLYDFLLGHEKDYGMEVVRMISADDDSRANIYKTTQENDFILVQHMADIFKNEPLRQSHGPFRNSNITLIVTCDKSSLITKIKLVYYVILTCPREDPLHYLSSHQSREEQVLLEILTAQASHCRKQIEEMVNKGSIDCRIHLLWNKLLSNSPVNSLSYSGLFDLKSLAHVEIFTEVDPQLTLLLDQPYSWYQSLMKVLSSKYSVDRCKMFMSSDNTIHHLLIIHPRFIDGFVMLTLDTSASKGELSIIFRQTEKQKREMERENIFNLFEGVINACCYHMWVSMLTS